MNLAEQAVAAMAAPKAPTTARERLISQAVARNAAEATSRLLLLVAALEAVNSHDIRDAYALDQIDALLPLLNELRSRYAPPAEPRQSTVPGFSVSGNGRFDRDE